MTNKFVLKLKNFQSIGKGELEFKEGLNFIIGQSNSGKSATFRAIEAALSNPTKSKKYIKNGENKAVVEIEYSGNNIIWEKSDKESSYEINNERYVKTGKSSALKILDDTGFALGTKDEIMNIESELQLPFPFDVSESELFKLFENVFCISDSAVILKGAKEREDNNKKDIIEAEAELERTETKIRAIESFESEVDISLLMQYKETLLSLSGALEKAKEGLPEIKRALKLEEANVEVPLYKDIENKANKLRDLANLKKVIERTKKLHALSVKLKEVTYDGVSVLQEYKDLKEAKKERDLLTSLSEVGEVKEESFENKIEPYKELIRIKREIEKLEKLKDLEVAETTFNSLLEERNALVSYKKELKAILEEGKVKKEALKKAEGIITELEEKLKEFKVCPLCHHPLE